jgi:mRNA-degrading endonuclease toxin of MazEF toxin-antitoxin module
MSLCRFVPGEIVLIRDAPFTDRLQVKPRPALIISGNQFNQNSPDVIVAPISSVIRLGDPMQIIIDDNEDYFTTTGLRISSAIKCGAIFAYSQSQIARRLGYVSSEILNKVREIVSNILYK